MRNTRAMLPRNNNNHSKMGIAFPQCPTIVHSKPAIGGIALVNALSLSLPPAQPPSSTEAMNDAPGWEGEVAQR